MCRGEDVHIKTDSMTEGFLQEDPRQVARVLLSSGLKIIPLSGLYCWQTQGLSLKTRGSYWGSYSVAKYLTHTAQLSYILVLPVHPSSPY